MINYSERMILEVYNTSVSLLFFIMHYFSNSLIIHNVISQPRDPNFAATCTRMTRYEFHVISSLRICSEMQVNEMHAP